MSSAPQPPPEVRVTVADFAAAWEILKHRQDEFSQWSRALVSATECAVLDVNGKRLVFEGLGYPHPEIGKLLQAVGAPFNPAYVHRPPPDGSNAKEYRLSVRYPWAQDRVM